MRDSFVWFDSIGGPMGLRRYGVVLGSVLWLISSIVTAQSVRLASGEYPPYLSQHLPYEGLLSKLVSDVFSEEGIEVTYSYFPWKRTMRLVEMGLYDGSPGWLKSPEREQKFLYSDSVFEGRGVFFYRTVGVRTQLNWKSFEDLQDLKIGLTLGYRYGEKFEQMREKNLFNIQIRPTDTNNFQHLLDGKIDLFPLDLCVGLYLIEQNFVRRKNEIDYSLKAMNLENYYVIFPKSATGEALRDKFNRGLRKMKQQHHFDQGECLGYFPSR